MFGGRVVAKQHIETHFFLNYEFILLKMQILL